jgi:kynureninase
MQDRASRELARQWDARDPLARFRRQFYRPAGQIYLDSDSLGLCSQEAERSLLRMLSDWKTKACERSRDGDFSSHETTARLARIVGASADEIAIGTSRTFNLQQLLATIYRRQFYRLRILTDGISAPQNREVLRQHLELRGLHGDSQLLVVDAEESRLLSEEKIETAMSDPMVQMAVLPVIVAATGQLLDASRLARAAREHGVMIGFDLSDSLGTMPHPLEEWGLDFAFWDHEKFASAGPGAAAGLFLHRRHFARAVNAAAKLHLDAPPLLSTAALEGALRLVEDAGLERLREKSLDLTHFLRAAIEREIPQLVFATPRETQHRGAHLALLHPDAGAICERLRANGVTANFREPDILGLAPAPLYNSFVECWDAVQILRRVMEQMPNESLENEIAS